MTYIPRSIPPELHDKVRGLVSDPATFCRLHQVQDKDTKREVPFVPLPMQAKIFDAVKAGHKRILVIKARQVAATTGCKMVLHQQWTATPTAALFALVSLRAESATALLDDNRRWMHHPPSILRRELDTRAKGELRLADTGATLKAFTSRSSTGLRSFSPIAALLSEFAFAPDQEELLAQALSAVGDGLLMLESTANNPGDRFSQLIAGAPENGFHLITHWWWEEPKYCDLGYDLDPEELRKVLGEWSEEELQLKEAYNLSNGQLAWRRRYLKQLGPYKFRREYPACLDDCFLGREGGYYGEEVLQDIHVIEHELHGKAHGREVEAPHPHDRYVMGVDIGGGVGGDYSALCVVSVSTMQPVYTERNNQVTPASWAHRCIQVASRYNNALMLAESNNHGHAFLLELTHCGYRYQWRSPQQKPWVTTLQSKLEAFDCLRESLQVIKVMDRVTWMELRSLTIPAGKVAPEAPKGGHDDSAMAMALTYRCLRDIPSSWRTHALQSGRTRIDDLISRSKARRIRSHSLPF